MSAYDDEQERRELAWQHRDDVDVDSATPITPKRLGTILSVRLDPGQARALWDYAQRSGCTPTQVIRYALAQVIQPTGWACEHLSWTSSPGALGKPEVGCGCDMQPVYPVAA